MARNGKELLDQMLGTVPQQERSSVTKAELEELIGKSEGSAKAGDPGKAGGRRPRRGSVGKPGSTRISVDIGTELHDRIRRRAFEENVTMSVLIREVLESSFGA